MKNVSKLLMLAVLGLILSTSTADAMLDYQTGRWLSQDPLGYVDGVNMYGYVSSRPTHHVDPTGLVGLGGNPTMGPGTYIDDGKPSSSSSGGGKNLDVVHGGQTLKFSFEDCSSSEIGKLTQQLKDAYDAISEALSDAEKLQDFLDDESAPSCSCAAKAGGAIRDWFGGQGNDFNDTVDDVVDVLEDMKDAFDGRIGIECESSCSNPAANAYVYGGFTDIHVCPNFWNNPNKRCSAILLHEMSHEYADTDDEGYWDPSTGEYMLNGKPVDLDLSDLLDNADTYEECLYDWYL
ncbi:MAG: hypothetical protein JEZ07_12435 [Phycisphaerae bacterium]|nr:hypothetical protein [Phycisphaerae bacterium]